ncbi:unnamed protein product [Owenia fusiformis]|uniref:Uncharacterized protein n=1 Tax=Owenia fusiformis TaxID=6347 RepID=A0A8J1U350_OWEFU|nr:unnamed protein product [Owenia fusiformis]
MARMPLLFLRGSYYECGFQKGEFFKSEIQTYYEELEPKMSAMLEFYHSKKGRDFCEGMMKAAREKYPQYVDENKGIADGAGITEEKAIMSILWSQLDDALGFAEKEIFAAYGKSIAAQGCSDIFVNNGKEKIIGHNNDWASNMKPFIQLAYYAEYTLPNGDVVPPQTLLAIGGHPARMQGSSWASGMGMVSSLNDLAILDNKLWSGVKLPSFILNRAMQHAKDKDDLVRILTDQGNGIGWGWTFCVNAGFIDDPNLYNVEVGPSTEAKSSVSVVTISQDKIIEKETAGVYSHFNHVKHLPDKGIRVQLCDIRQARFDELPTPHDLESVLNIMGDENHDDFPIYRANGEGHLWFTNWSSVMDFNGKRVLVYKDNPKTSEPIAILPFSLVMDDKP